MMMLEIDSGLSALLPDKMIDKLDEICSGCGIFELKVDARRRERYAKNKERIKINHREGYQKNRAEGI